jgi:hypothetical protein
MPERRPPSKRTRAAASTRSIRRPRRSASGTSRRGWHTPAVSAVTAGTFTASPATRCTSAANSPTGGRGSELFELLDDAGGASLGDLTRPVKTEFEPFERAERRIRRAVWTALDVEPPTGAEWGAVMAADDRPLAYEADELGRTVGADGWLRYLNQ